MDPETLPDDVYLYVSKLSIHTSVPSNDPNSEPVESSGFGETIEEMGGGSIR
jgi:hypothetical protein